MGLGLNSVFTTYSLGQDANLSESLFAQCERGISLLTELVEGPNAKCTVPGILER